MFSSVKKATLNTERVITQITDIEKLYVQLSSNEKTTDKVIETKTKCQKCHVFPCRNSLGKWNHLNENLFKNTNEGLKMATNNIFEEIIYEYDAIASRSIDINGIIIVKLQLFKYISPYHYGQRVYITT